LLFDWFFLPSTQLQEAYAMQLKHNLWRSVLLIVGCNLLFLNRSWSVRGVLFHFFCIFLFCLEKVIWNPCMHKEFLTHSIFPHQKQRQCLLIIDECPLRATIFARFFRVMSIFTLAKTKIIPGFKINMHLWKTQAVNWISICDCS
jgi:hypothetical protein